MPGCLTLFLSYLCPSRTQVNPPESRNSSTLIPASLTADSVRTHGPKVGKDSNVAVTLIINDELESDPYSAPGCSGTDNAVSQPMERQQLQMHDNILLNNDSITTSGAQGTTGFFTNSHNLTFNNPVMYDVKNTTEPVLRWLTDSNFLMRGAEFDSDLRDPPPRCHPGTRLDLLQTILQWFHNPEREQRSLWMKGSAAVGKSAIMQTLAEKLWLTKYLGASLFFSRPNGRTNPFFVFPTLAYQLAVRIPFYCQYLERKVAEDPKLLEKNIEHQFRTLITQPFSSMTESQVSRLAIIIDGLDECEGQDAQIRIINLISDFAIRFPDSPLIWIIASRPEYHLTVVFESTDVIGSVRILEIPVDSSRACQDVEKFLRDEFKKICRKYPNDIPLGPQWPVEQDLTTICKASSGHFGFASILARFISDDLIGDPINQFMIVLSIAEHPHIDPLASLHSLYIRILDFVPKHLLASLKLLLAYNLIKTMNPYSFPTGENFVYPLVFAATIFNLQQNTVYAALRRLHSVIRVPSIEDSGKTNIHFYHASFSDFLCDASKSGEYVLDAREYYTQLWRCCYSLVSTYWSHPWPTPPLKMAWDARIAYPHQVGYIGDLLSSLNQEIIYYFIHYLLPSCYGGCTKFPHIQVSLSQAEIHNVFETVNFSQIHPQTVTAVHGFIKMYNWLLGEAPDTLRNSALVTEVNLEEFDFTRIATNKLSVHIHDYAWLGCYSDSPCTNFSLSKHILEVQPIAALIHDLEDLRTSNPLLKVVILGKCPSQSVALICDPEERGLYYIPYAH